MPTSWTIRAAATLGFLGVALGAFGAHSLKRVLNDFGTADIWETAVFYQLVHAVALLALAITDRASRLLSILWIVGIVIFSGTLYIIATSEMKWLGAITPIGGVLLLVGWLLVAIRGR